MLFVYILVVYTCCLFVSGASPELQQLLAQASNRVKGALKPKTQRTYALIFKHFLKFLFHHSFHPPTVPVQALLAYLEHLVHSSLSYPTILNRVSSLKYMFSRFQWPLHIFHHPLVSQLLHSVDVNVPRSLPPRQVFSISNMQALIRASGHHPLGRLLRPLFLLAFFGFLRISNLLHIIIIH